MFEGVVNFFTGRDKKEDNNKAQGSKNQVRTTQTLTSSAKNTSTNKRGGSSPWPTQSKSATTLNKAAASNTTAVNTKKETPAATTSPKKGWFGSFVDGVVDFGKDVAGTVVDTVGNIGNATLDAVDDVKDAWDENFGKNSQDESSFTDKLWDFGGKVLGEGTELLVKSGSEVLAGGTKIVSEGAASVTETFSPETATKIRDAGGDVSNLVRESGYIVADIAEDITYSGVNAFKSYTENMVDSVGDLGENLLEVGSNAWEGIKNGRTGFDIIFDAAGGLAGAGTEFLMKNTVNTVASAGQFLVDGTSRIAEEFSPEVAEKIDTYGTMATNIYRAVGNMGAEFAGEVMHGAIAGDSVENPTVGQVIGQVAIGFIPGVDQLADLRDITGASIAKDPERMAFSLIGLIPEVGNLGKYSDELAGVLKNTPDMAKSLNNIPVLIDSFKNMPEMTALIKNPEVLESLAKNSDELAELISNPKLIAELSNNPQLFETMLKEPKLMENMVPGFGKRAGAVTKVDLDKMSLDEYMKFEALGDEMYNAIRKSNVDIDAIAKNTGWDKEKIEAIKNHLFKQEHLFDDGTTRVFDSDYWQAEAWKRMESGEMDDLDELLLQHEYFELEYMKKNKCTYEEAHRETSKIYDWYKEKFEVNQPVNSSGRQTGGHNSAEGGVSSGGSLWKPAKKKADLWSKGKLKIHFENHGPEFGAKSAQEYSDMACEFATRNSASIIQVKKGAFIYRYEPSTKTVFVGTDAGGKIKTFYKWDGRSDDDVINTLKGLGLIE
jgi:ribosomal protein L18E